MALQAGYAKLRDHIFEQQEKLSSTSPLELTRIYNNMRRPVWCEGLPLEGEALAPLAPLAPFGKDNLA